LGRIDRHWSAQELANRVGVTRSTINKIEHGDPSVGLGVALEAAALVGAPLFSEDDGLRRLELGRVSDRLALLPKRVRRPLMVNDAF
jgi:DNA-binding XRE family transcriptional regulator